ncbi:MAG: hypothetical protein IJZ39_13130 [Oscillospiraceae bacterium]|nr:hypothetical protein [Oscillospiraceae bacterium]
MLGMITGSWFADLLFYGIPVLAIIFFVMCLRDYRKAKRQSFTDPGSVTRGQLRGKLILTIVLGVIAACLTVVVVGFVSLLFMVIAFM